MGATKLILDYAYWRAALQALKSVAGTGAPFDVVRVYIETDTDTVPTMSLCAVNLRSTVHISLDVDLLDARDQDKALEFSKADIAALQKMVFAKTEMADQVVGIEISDEAITFTDETGLGLGIVKSQSIPRLPELSPLGDPRESIRRAFQQARSLQEERKGFFSELPAVPSQLDAIAKVSRAMPGKVRIRVATMRDDNTPLRLLAHSSMWAMTTTDSPDDNVVFALKPTALQEEKQELEQRPRVVSAIPTAGIS